MQLDVADRGFAYREDAPLDMRMDPTTGPTAADVLNTYPQDELTRVLREYGEERFAPRIAAAVVRERDREPFSTSGAAGRAALRPDPRARTAYRRTSGQAHLPGAADGGQRRARRAAVGRSRPRSTSLAVGGRVVVESYHSLEDRLVKQAFAAVTTVDVPPDLPFVPEDRQPALRLVTRGAERADGAEIADNPRAASVRLRAVERVRPRTTTHDRRGKGAA